MDWDWEYYLMPDELQREGSLTSQEPYPAVTSSGNPRHEDDREWIVHWTANLADPEGTETTGLMSRHETGVVIEVTLDPASYPRLPQ